MTDSFFQDAPFRDVDHRLIAILRGITPSETESVVSLLLESDLRRLKCRLIRLMRLNRSPLPHPW